ncbi:hypothetical protein, variant 2 [Aphanomyces astaci]|uniref:Uncharacterized protein n=1 Tax=Aphanomyces astaci TaxID=112090 RepID=W4GYT9_APHAT|nr:hypothetical protein, variant 2 [Aphanomyces astaci]ETV84068.1 hypothetical protein, variant 2 [Aphanomyces astaci]RHX99561.1 hypothetical protein DYB36_008725 [Aphanomyces astaci]RHY54945.1 hypothetical protein DYB38_003112 [Aphanomyces astaci]RHY65575.1 hypothetical protein DYB30_010396 [Aphanomyces astaci]RHY88666.1 hypothetical protein DYB35_004641 [Aphanomyces astaci]|eukprot:XP_009825760.1 hypothetical protein, variant 2 [Aphanomyces astaci]
MEEHGRKSLEVENPEKPRVASTDDTSDVEVDEEEEDLGDVDVRGVPTWLKYERQPGWHKMWEFMHKLETPYRVGSKETTHICLMCMDSIAKSGGSWKKALKVVNTTTIGMKHIERKHPQISQEIELARLEKKATKAKGLNKRAALLALARGATSTEAPPKKFKVLSKPLWIPSADIDVNAVKSDIQQKIQSVTTTMTQHTKVQYILLVVIGCLFKHGLISGNARSALKSQAINEPEGILLAAVELLLVDWDLDECVDTFLRVSHTILGSDDAE